ncbi:hypothetical protein F511_20292 [Dorcoceras hygrometricum]|uniref:Dystroglycan-like n=1 Tax=Dorcoceras hygrometricum TaxID=472368 RepID=A0A2Z7CSU3_9LAMI|nr:hypothetical protein F511_20292 [Dorcoceras hygrometricum]
MASSLICNTVHILFDSVLAMDNEGIVAMFEALVASGQKGFLGFPAVIYEAALIEFFQHGSVRYGMVVSTIQGKSVEISEEVFAGSFELPMDGLKDLNEVPKDLVFDARSIFSFTCEQVSTSCKMREMKIEFRLLSDILEKSIFVKAGSLDAVTHERFLLMTAIDGGVKINWGRLLFNIFKDMVTAGSRQAKGYAVQICVLLKNIPNLELGDSEEFPPLKILTARTVGKYIAINDKITIEDVEGVAGKSRVKKTPTKKAVSKKRPAAALDVPIAKKKRTTVRKATKSSALVTVAQEVIPLQIFEPIRDVPAVLPSKPKRKSPKRRLKFPAESDDESVEKETAAGSIAEKDSVPTEADGTETADVVPTTDEKRTDDESLSLEEIFSTIPVGCSLPSTIGEVTKMQLGMSITIRGVNEGDWYKASLPKIPAAAKEDSATDQLILPSTAMDISASFATLRESISRLISNQTRDFRKSGDAHGEVMSKINHVERVLLDSIAEKNQAFRGLIKSIRQEAHNDNDVPPIALKAVRAQNAILTTDLADVRQEVKDLKAEFSKDFDDKLAVIRNDLLEFCVETQGQLASLGTNLAELIAFITKDSDDKKGEVSSSHGRGQPPDDQSRPSGGSTSRGGGDGSSRRRDDRRGSSTKRGSSSGGGGSGTAGEPYKKNAEWWLYGKNQF